MLTAQRRALLTGLLATLLATGVGAADLPGVYITAGDTACFSPASALSTTGSPGKWYLRKVGFAARGEMILNPQAGGLHPDLTCSPRLRGRYNMYVNLREVHFLCGLQLKLSNEALAYTVTPALGTAEVHTNREILVAKDLLLDGQTVLLRHIGRLVYFSYLRFVPVAEDDPQAQVDPRRVVREPLIDVRAQWRETRDTVPEGMTRIVHVSPRPAAAAVPGAAGYVVFSRPWLDLVFPDTVPAADEVTTELHAAAARGEYEPVTFAVHAARDLGACKVSVEDLRDGAKTIGKGNVAVSSVALRNLRTAYNGTRYMLVPAMLDDSSAVTVPAGQTRQVWLTLHVPAAAAPGLYTTTVTVSPAQAPPTRLRLRVRVWPFTLREPSDVACGMYDVLWGAGAEAGWLRGRFAEMRRHGLTTVAYCGGLNAALALRDGRAQIVFDGKGGLEQALDAYRDTGFPHPMLWMMTDELWSWCGAQAAPGSDRFRALYVAAVQSLLAECRRRRWQVPLFQPVDEPGSYEARPNAALMERWATETELLKQAGATVEVDHIPFSTEDPRLKGALERALPCVDVFTQRYSNRLVWFEKDGWWWANMKARAAEWGKRLWSYNINDAAFFPELPTYRLAYGHFLWQEGVKGQFLWVYQSACGNPLNCLDGPYTDFMYTYPALAAAGEPGGPSLMWEAIREGRDDYNYLHTLRCLIEEQERRGHGARTAAAQELLTRLQGSFDEEALRARNRYLECQWEAEGTGPDGERSATGAFNVPNGWSLGDYDRWRTAVAEAAAKLSADH